MNRHVLLRTRDFKSRASASFAIRAVRLRLEENTSVLQGAVGIVTSKGCD